MVDWWVDQKVVPSAHGAPLVSAKVYLRSSVGGEVQVYQPPRTAAEAHRRWSVNIPPPPVRRPRNANETRALAIELRTGQTAPDEMRRLRAAHAYRAKQAKEKRADAIWGSGRNDS